MDFLKLSESGAKKICGQGQCVCSYPCGHDNKEKHTLPLINPEHTECPLAKYNVTPDSTTTPWYKRPASETVVTDDEMFALCARCENTNGVEICGDYMEVNPIDHSRCYDCPVHVTRECIAENQAEAR